MSRPQTTSRGCPALKESLWVWLSPSHGGEELISEITCSGDQLEWAVGSLRHTVGRLHYKQISFQPYSFSLSLFFSIHPLFDAYQGPAFCGSRLSKVAHTATSSSFSWGILRPDGIYNPCGVPGSAPWPPLWTRPRLSSPLFSSRVRCPETWRCWLVSLSHGPMNRTSSSTRHPEGLLLHLDGFPHWWSTASQDAMTGTNHLLTVQVALLRPWSRFWEKEWIVENVQSFAEHVELPIITPVHQNTCNTHLHPQTGAFTLREQPSMFVSGRRDMMTNQLDHNHKMNTPAMSSVKKIQVLITSFSKNKQTCCPYQTYRQVAGSLWEH